MSKNFNFGWIEDYRETDGLESNFYEVSIVKLLSNNNTDFKFRHYYKNILVSFKNKNNVTLFINKNYPNYKITSIVDIKTIKEITNIELVKIKNEIYIFNRLKFKTYYGTFEESDNMMITRIMRKFSKNIQIICPNYKESDIFSNFIIKHNKNLNRKDLYFMSTEEAIKKVKKEMNGWSELKVKRYIFLLQKNKPNTNCIQIRKLNKTDYNPNDVFNLFKEIKNKTNSENDLIIKSIKEAQDYCITYCYGTKNNVLQKAIRIIYYKESMKKINKDIRNSKIYKSQYKGSKIYHITTIDDIIAIQFLTKNINILHTKEFNDIVSIILKFLEITRIYKLEKLLLVPINNKKTIADLINETKLNIIIGDLKRVTSIPESDNIIYDYYENNNNTKSAMIIYNVSKEVNKNLNEYYKIKEFISKLLDKMTEIKPLCIKESDLLKEITNKEFLKCRDDNKKFLQEKYNEFLNNSVLDRQIIENEKISDTIKKLKINIIDFNYIAT